MLHSQYDFQQLFALIWLSPEKYGEAPKTLKHDLHDDNSNCSRSVQVIVPQVSSLLKKAFTLLMTNIINNHGSLKMQQSWLYHHLPTHHQVKDSSFSLQRQALVDNTYKRRGNIIQCDSCNINLCIECLNLFHLVEDVKGFKSEVKKIIRHDGKKFLLRCSDTGDGISDMNTHS